MCPLFARDLVSIRWLSTSKHRNGTECVCVCAWFHALFDFRRCNPIIAVIPGVLFKRSLEHYLEPNTSHCVKATELNIPLILSLLSLLGSICTPFSQCLYNDLYSQFAEWWLFIRLHVVVTRCCLCRSKAYFREKQECNWVCDTHTANNLNIDQIRSTFLLFFAFTLWFSLLCISHKMEETFNI